MQPFNPFVAGVSAPPIPEARGWASRYDGAYGPAIDLTQAVPGYPPHPDMVDRIAAAARDPAIYSYGAITGDLALRESYAAEMSGLYGGAVAPTEIAITTGANMGSYAVTTLLAGPGDAIMLPVPWYFNHQMNAGLLGVEVIPLPCRAEDGFVPDPQRAEALLHERVKAILLVTPNNPTGAVYPPEVIDGRRGPAARRLRPALAGSRDRAVQLLEILLRAGLPGRRGHGRGAPPRADDEDLGLPSDLRRPAGTGGAVLGDPGTRRMA